MITHVNAKPGVKVKGKVIDVLNEGAIVQLPSDIEAHCPAQHMSEFRLANPSEIFKVGAVLNFRILGCKAEKITLTHKEKLVKSKLKILSSYTDAIEGLVTHGWISHIEEHGCFVRFYNGVRGFALRSELGEEPGCDTSLRYDIGQVVKCRVARSDPASHRIYLSLLDSPTETCEDDMINLSLLDSPTETCEDDMIKLGYKCLLNNQYCKPTISNCIFAVLCGLQSEKIVVQLVLLTECVCNIIIA